MKIFNNEPQNWEDLQMYIGQLFSECGFVTEISKVVDLVRGKKEIDIYCQDNKSEFNPIILIECKFWNKPVHQEVIHSFRTVVNDIGGNIGYIVSKCGFQKGCFEAIEKTNIQLVSLEELSKIYYSKWLRNMVKIREQVAKQFLPYWICSSKPDLFVNGKPIDFSIQLLISQAYSPICDLNLKNFMEDGFVIYPFKVPIIDDTFNIIGEYEINNDREYFDFCDNKHELALKHFKLLFDH